MNKVHGCLLVCALALLAVSQSAASPQDVAKVPEGLVRKVAIKVVKPEYPRVSRKHRSQGLVVALVDIDQNGNVTNVKVEEAPDEDTGASVVRAVKQWKFAPLVAEGKPVRLQGKLSFYFSIRNGKTRVDDPKRFSDTSRQR